MREETFESWRARARQYLLDDIPPDRIHWEAKDLQPSLFSEPQKKSASAQAQSISIPKKFMTLATSIACHRDPERWSLLYQALWRLTHGEKHLMHLSTDTLMRKLMLMYKAVRRDAHKAKAFVRFRLVKEADGDHYIAWHRPDHYILPLVAPFFARRFSVMRWTVLTSDASVHWNGEKLEYGPGVPQSEAPTDDRLEDLWKDYYRATFNPARIKIGMMKSEMPVRYWQTMPETAIIKDMLKEAPDRVQTMIAAQEGFRTSAQDFLPSSQTIAELRKAAAGCQGCPLYKDTTCTVFGEGPDDARLMMVGEQPGNEEDLQGRPFVGPAGKVLADAMEQAEIDRVKTYMTNAVKHFKHDRMGLERYHRTPTQRETTACNPWLRAEIAAVKPDVIVSLGVTAGRALLGPGFSLKTYAGKTAQGGDGTLIVPTYHPAAVLRMPDKDKAQEILETIVRDISRARTLMNRAI